MKTHQHLPWLDLIRFLAAAEVCLCHARGFFLPEYALLPAPDKGICPFIFYFLTRLGHESVIVFFVLSGFLVGGISIRNLCQRSFDFKRYCANRLARIVPPLIGTLLFIFLVSFALGQPPWTTYIGNLLSLQGIFVPSISAPFWSLSYEVWFYILTASVGLFCISHGYRRICSFLLLGTCIAVFCKLSPLYLFIWLCGALAYNCRRDAQPSRWIIFANLTVVASAIVLCELSSSTNAILLRIAISPQCADLLLGVSFSTLLAFITSSGRKEGRWTSSVQSWPQPHIPCTFLIIPFSTFYSIAEWRDKENCPRRHY